ncbi:MAG: hypothetical protein J0I28_09040 [Caulobacterales bacterium]|nr:hypothetical protein [Caulobacterales bacterium]
MDLRAEMLRLRETAARLFREHVAPRPIVAGGMAAALIGVIAGFGLTAGLVWEQTPQRAAVIKPAAPPAPVPLMVDANGRTPDYVRGTDHVRGAPDAESVVKVTGPPTPTFEEQEDMAQAGERHWWAPWSWGRADEEDIRQQQADRLAEAREAAYEARMAARERTQRRYDERMAEYERDTERYDRYGRRTYEPEPEPVYEPPPEARPRRPVWW